MKLKLKELPLLGYINPPYSQRRMTDKEMKRNDIDKEKFYLVCYNGIWLIGQFDMVHWGWNFSPNLGVMGVQVNDLEKIYEIEGLPQKRPGDTASFIMDYLSKETENEEDE